MAQIKAFLFVTITISPDVLVTSLIRKLSEWTVPRCQQGTKTQDSLDQCPMLINADQNHNISTNCQYMPINAGSILPDLALIGIDRN